MKNTVILSTAIIFTVCFATNAQIRVASSNNVGIGIDNPLEKLHINGSIRGNQNGAIRINSGNGYIDIGPTNIYFAHITTDRSQFYFNKRIINYEGIISSYGSADLSLCTSSNFTTRITVKNSNGNVGIGTTTPAYKLDVNGDIATFGTLRISSDERLKTEIKPLGKSLEKIKEIQPIEFKYKLSEKSVVAASDTSSLSIEEPETAFYDQIRLGFSAQELQKIYPQLVSAGNDGMLNVDYIGLIPVLVEAIKEQQAKIEELSEQVAKLSGIKPK